MDAGTATAVAVPIVLLIVWAVRVEARAAATPEHDRRISVLERDVSGHDESLKGMRDDVKYIRERVDRALNGKHE